MADADKPAGPQPPEPGGAEPAAPAEGAAAKPRSRGGARPKDESGSASGPAEQRATKTAAGGGRQRAEPADEEPAAHALSGSAGLKLHHLRPAPGAHKARMRVGRGDASKGKTAGRGTKGTKARGAVAPRFEGGQMPLHRRVPKLRGFSNLRFKTTYQVVNTGRLAELYPEGGDVTPDDLVAKGAVRGGELVKILGSGDVAAALRVSAHAFSASAKQKITAAGGTVTQL